MTTTIHTNPTRLRGTAGNDLARNIALISLLWLAYAAVRGITAGDLVTATENAHSIVELQAAVGLPSEQAIQQAVLDHTWLLRSANVHYLAVHFPLTVAFLGWAWRRHRASFARIRNALIATTSVGLVVHLAYPLTPPRMLRGFVDTAAILGPDPYDLSISAGANQLAAMPSLHVGWALLVALGIVSVGTTRLRWVALLHPLITLAVVVITANHYWTDAIVAVAITSTMWHLSGRFHPTARLRMA
jgi:hypothetical protein